MSKKIAVALKQLSKNRYRVNRLTNALYLTFPKGIVKVGDEIDSFEAKELCEDENVSVNVTLP